MCVENEHDYEQAEIRLLKISEKSFLSIAEWMCVEHRWRRSFGKRVKPS